jgi:hypothetical protein
MTLLAAAATHAHPAPNQGWEGWVVLALAVVVFVFVGRWWIRNLRRKRGT